MSRRFFGFLVLFSFLASAPFLFSQPKTLTILHTNDTHSCLFPFGPQDSLGGIARMSTLIKQLKARNANVLTLHAGDVFVGTFEFNKYLGYPELKIMEGLYDAMELGNHEFDLGPGALFGVLSGGMLGKSPIMMPVICANLDPADTPADLYALVLPHLIKDVGEPGNTVKVGIFGVVTTEPQNYTEEVLELLTDPIAAAKAQVAILQGAGCEVIVCVSHLGLTTDANTDPMTGLAGVDGIDIIIGGHSHDALSDPVDSNEKIIVQAGYFGRFLGELKVKVKESGGVELISYKLHKVDQKIRKDPHLLWTLNMLRVGLVNDPRFGPVLTKNVAKADWDMEKSFPEDQPTFRDTAVGNLVSDALRWGLGRAGYDVDASLEALGYVGSKIYKGKIVGNDVMRVVPYGYDQTSGLGFKIVVVELTGAQLWGGLEYSVQYAPYSYDMAMQPSGLAFGYNSDNLPGNRMLWVYINGNFVNPLDPVTTYKVALNEQVYNVLNSLGTPIPKVDTGLFEYNLVRNYMKKLVHVRYGAEGRVIDSGLE
jgi:5'-nucleotidase/2',3'-cyclic-nucleotide 2'-phosphodiesterase/3'-nucleotidase/5'-nucleotidase